MKIILQYFIILFTLFLSVGCGGTTTSNDDTSNTNTASTLTGSYKIVDTNQTLCYESGTGNTATCTEGNDGYLTLNTPSYNTTTINGDALTTDNITGLVWQKTSNTSKLSPTDASDYCNNLTYGGESDWRLPSIKELYSLIEFSGVDLSGLSGATTAGVSVNTTGYTPFIDSTYFDVLYGNTTANERIIDAQYNTATNYVSTTMNGSETMFGVNFVDGRIKGYPTSQTYYTRCVRGNTDYGTNNFVNNNDNTISDKATQLMWQQNDTQSSDYENAISICNNATTGGHSDWRLPNIKELHSIVDYTKSPDKTSTASINTTYFNVTSFTNEEGESDWGFYWSSTTHLDSDSKGQNGAYISFGRALGYMNSAILDVHGAGAQRSNYKKIEQITSQSNATYGSTIFYYKGPQGDILRVDNMVRCVRSID